MNSQFSFDWKTCWRLPRSKVNSGEVACECESKRRKLLCDVH